MNISWLGWQKTGINTELKIEKACKNDYSGIVMVVCAMIDKENDTDTNLMQRFEDNDLGLKHV